ncbi:MAG: hypothetical protein ACJARR_003156 [Pseudophaeobacter arcticus]|jgi:hypothetical protein
MGLLQAAVSPNLPVLQPAQTAAHSGYEHMRLTIVNSA